MKKRRKRIYACAEHTAAVQNAEAADLAGEFDKACDIWSAEIETLYETLLAAAQGEGKAAVVNDRAAFAAYADAYRALRGDEAASELLRLRCAELCCMVKTAPERLPDSLLVEYGRLMDRAVQNCGKNIGALKGSDAEVTERYDEVHARVFQEVVRLVRSARYSVAQANAFDKALRTWQMNLDSIVNAQYKAADKDTRKQIAAVRVGLDKVYAARGELLKRLYADAPEAAAEALSSLYRNALVDFCGKE